jgi:hypothetical protein
MAKTKISEFDVDPSNNTDINSINIAEGCAPSGINNAIRQLMSDLKEQQTGASGDNFTVGGNLAVTGTSTFTGATTFTGAVVFSSTISGLNGKTIDNATLTNVASLSLEGTTANDFETTIASDPTADRTITLPDATDTLVGKATTDTLTNKTVALGSNTVSGTKAQFNTAVTDTDFVFNNDFSGSNQSLSSNGYQKLPSGLIMQWGTSSSIGPDGTATITYPTAFPSATGAVQITPIISLQIGGQGVQSVSSVSTSSFVINNGLDASMSFYWFAIGY